MSITERKELTLYPFKKQRVMKTDLDDYSDMTRVDVLSALPKFAQYHHTIFEKDQMVDIYVWYAKDGAKYYYYTHN
jgi:hypothetical protein